MRTWIWVCVICFLFCGPAVVAQEEPAAPEGEEDIDIDFEFDWDHWDGIQVHSKNIDMHIGGRFVVDTIKYGHANRRDSGVELDDARLIIEGKWSSFTWWAEADLVGVDTPRNLYEAWGAWNFSPALRVAGGQFRVAHSSEFATREEHLPFAGYAFPAYLDGRYDVGIRADGDLLPERLWYQATVTAGKGFNLEGNRLNSTLYGVRVVTHPFASADTMDEGFLNNFKGIFGGVAYSYLSDFDDPIIITTPYESTVFRTADLDGDGGNWLHYEVGYHGGPFRIAWERVVGEASDVPVGAGIEEDMDQLTSWALYGSWNITGETHHWSRGRWVESGPEETNWLGMEGFPGRLELASRYSNADIDRGLFDYGLTNYMISTQEVRTFSLELGWFPTEYVRIALGWVRTIADHELITFGDTNRDSSYLVRLDVNF